MIGRGWQGEPLVPVPTHMAPGSTEMEDIDTTKFGRKKQYLIIIIVHFIVNSRNSAEKRKKNHVGLMLVILHKCIHLPVVVSKAILKL